MTNGENPSWQGDSPFFVFRGRELQKSIEKCRIFGTLCAKVPKFTKNS